MWFQFMDMVKLKKGHWIVLLFTVLYILIFATYYILNKNYEFLWYVVIMLLIFVLIILTIKRSNFDYIVLWGLSIWGLLHMAGGAVHVGDGVLYALKVFPIIDRGGEFFILKMDQVIHAYGFAFTTLVAWFLLKPQLKENPNYKIIYPLLIFIAMGAGALYEIAEFISTII